MIHVVNEWQTHRQLRQWIRRDTVGVTTTVSRVCSADSFALFFGAIIDRVSHHGHGHVRRVLKIVEGNFAYMAAIRVHVLVKPPQIDSTNRIRNFDCVQLQNPGSSIP
jgi:hypothetical protein